mgnify:CR=1 FL=1
MSKGICFLCQNWEELEEHHIFPGPFRPISTKYKLTVRVCAGCHREDRDAIHRCGAPRLAVQKYGQKKAMREQGWSVEEFIQRLGKNYLDPEDMEEEVQEEGFFQLLDDIPLFI